MAAMGPQETLMWQMYRVLGALVARNGGDPVVLSAKELDRLCGQRLCVAAETGGGLIVWLKDSPFLDGPATVTEPEDPRE